MRGPRQHKAAMAQNYKEKLFPLTPKGKDRVTMSAVATTALASISETASDD